MITLFCEPIANAAIDLSDYPTYRLNFAIDLECSSQVSPDILVGSDQYWNIPTGELIKGETGPVALNTYFGWMLSGPAMGKGVRPSQCHFGYTCPEDGWSQ